ncbi:MAG: thioredoxin family protein [Fimbriimonadaceae bacterium]|nr:hypothetical protein [Chthonomonadaceae bacterium]MCO5298245.1 thioredoxin family protein [Fimbriimonadaceae bacterium]
MFPSDKFKEKAADFVLVKIDVDQQGELASKYEVSGIPDIIFLAPDGTVKHRALGFRGTEGLIQEMDKAKAL